MTSPPRGWLRSPGSLPVLAAVVVVVMAGVLAAGAGLTVRVNGSLTTLRAMTVDAAAVTDSATDLLLGLQEAEVAVSGYLLTAKPAYRRSFGVAADKVEASLALLNAQAAQQPWLPAETAVLQRVTTDKLAELRRGLGAVDRDGLEAGRATQRTQDSLGSMAAVRTLIDHVVTRAEAERDNRSMAVHMREQTVMFAVLLLAIGGVLLLGTAALALLAGRSRLLRAKDVIQVQGTRWQATVEAMPEGVAVFDSADRLLLWSQNLLAVSGLPQGLDRAGTPFAQFTAAAAGLWQPPLLDSLKPSQQTEMRAGERILHVSRNPMPDGGHMLVVVDATRRVHAESIARQAQKMEVLGQLTGGVAHDFNNLLQAVSANLELMANRIGGDPWLRQRLQAATDGVARGAQLTRHLLAFARRQPLSPETVDTTQLMAGLEDMLRRTLGPTVTLEIRCPSDAWPLRADAHQLENAILNLAINGRDAMATQPGTAGPAASRLVITVANAASPGADRVSITVADTGCGMTPEQMSRAMEPFYTTKPEGQGTGLGLPMVYGFAEQSGGHLLLSSVLGEGTRATLSIPRAAGAVAVVERSGPAKIVLPGAGELILLVEDEPEVRAAAAMALREHGYQVAEAGNPDTAWHMLEGGLRPDLLFSDLMMPGAMTAVELGRRAKALLPGLPVIFTSGYAEAARAEGVPVLPKPWRMSELAQRLRTALDGRPAADNRRYRILLVEDDALVLTVTAEMLAATGHSVSEATNAQDALAALDGIEVLITDIGLGETDGLTLAQQARDRHPGLPVVVATGHSRAPGLDRGGLVWLPKPFTGAALTSAIAHAVRAAQVPALTG